MAELSPLRRHMIEDMTIRNMSPATQRSYIKAASKFSRYFGRLPDKLTLDDVRFPGSSRIDGHFVAWVVPNRLRPAFLLRRHARRGSRARADSTAREPRKLPIVLSADEVVRFRSRFESEELRCADDSLRGGTAGPRGRGAPSRGCRQRPWRHSGASRQGREGPQRDAVAAASRHPAHVLAARQAEDVSVPRPR